MISREDVVAAYRLILGRDPESDTAVESHMRTQDVESLRGTFLQSAEFRSAVLNQPCPPPFPAFIHWAAPIRVDLNADDETMRRLFQRVERCWAHQAETEPYWSVLSHDRFKRETFASHAEEFYAGGEGEVRRLTVWLDRNGVNRSHFGSCLELGCGVGRVTPWLARQFRRVVACDISASHMQLAMAHATQQGIQNVEFVHTSRIESFDSLPAVDVIFSVLVLQHNPPPIIYTLLDRVFRLLRPGGVAFFQVPTYWGGYQFDIQAYLSLPERRNIEMHVIPQRAVFEVARSADCSMLEIEPDLYVEPDWVSDTFLVMKRSRRFRWAPPWK